VKADASIYEGKRVIRRVLERVPGLARVDPNAVTLSILVPAAVAAVALWLGWWSLLVVALVVRMVLATLDGFIAERFDRASRLGAYLNRLVTEVADAFLLVALVGRAEPLWVAAALGTAWLVNVLGVLGPIAGGQIQWTGPAGQADRLALFIAAAVLAQLGIMDWTVFCELLVALGAITILRRASRSVAELRAS